MSHSTTVNIIAHIYNDFSTKFGVPRQSGIVNSLFSKIIFEPEYRNPDSLRGLDGYSHIWLLWQFSETAQKGWSPTVRPPKLGGNIRVGVFASRSPFRPNPIGMSSVRLTDIDLYTSEGPVLYVSGADLMNNTPIYDIKPYLAYTDSHPDAAHGFATPPSCSRIKVNFPDALLNKIPLQLRAGLIETLEQDPRPGYKNDSDRIYGIAFAGFDIGFSVEDNCLTVLTVKDLK